MGRYKYIRQPPVKHRYDPEWDDLPQHHHGLAKRMDWQNPKGYQYQSYCECKGYRDDEWVTLTEAVTHFRQHVGWIRLQLQFDMEPTTGGPFE